MSLDDLLRDLGALRDENLRLMADNERLRALLRGSLLRERALLDSNESPPDDQNTLGINQGDVPADGEWHHVVASPTGVRVDEPLARFRMHEAIEDMAEHDTGRKVKLVSPLDDLDHLVVPGRSGRLSGTNVRVDAGPLHDTPLVARDDVRRHLLAELDRLREPHEPKIRTSGVSVGYLAALADVRRWAGGDDE